MFMLKDIEKIKLISITKQISRHGAVHTHYPHRIILRLSAVMDYIVQGERIRLEPGDVLFLSNSPPYQALYPSAQTGSTVMINFEGVLPDTPSGAYVIRKQSELHRQIMQLYRFWAVQTATNRCRCMALLWEVLATFAEDGKYSAGYAGRILDPALAYLEQHILDPELRVGKLHALCGISDTYFRRLFEERFSLTPKRYVLSRRLAQAKAILDSGEFVGIAAVAAAVGFEDSLYFSKAFKSKYGYPPSENR